MTRADEVELLWWRHIFSCRFLGGNLPRPHTALLGSRFVLMVDTGDGLVPFDEKDYR